MTFRDILLTQASPLGVAVGGAPMAQPTTGRYVVGHGSTLTKYGRIKDTLVLRDLVSSPEVIRRGR